MIELTEEHFKFFALSFFVAMPSVKAITLSNVALDNSNCNFYFSFWNSENFNKKIKDDKHWRFIQNTEHIDVLKNIYISKFGFLAKTKGVYVIKRSDFPTLNNKSYVINDYMTFALRFGYFFYNLKASNIRYDRRGFHLYINNIDPITFPCDSMITRRNNESFEINRDDFYIFCSLMINSFRKKGIIQ